jgi:hypothetical protein
VLRGHLVSQLVYDVLQLCPDQKQQLQHTHTGERNRISEQYRNYMQQISCCIGDILLLACLVDQCRNGTYRQWDQRDPEIGVPP